MFLKDHSATHSSTVVATVHKTTYSAKYVTLWDKKSTQNNKYTEWYKAIATMK